MKKILIVLVLFSSLIITPVILFTGGFSSSKNVAEAEVIEGNLNISPAVSKWRGEVEKSAKKWGIPDKVNWILAIMMVETGGSERDIMQSSESKGLPMNSISNEKESIDAGVEHLSKAIKSAKELGCNDEAAIGAYNFGLAYVSYVAKNGKKHSLEIAEKYSREVVAPSLGNSTGQRYSYVNAISLKFNKTYLYLNGGNFFYVEMVKQYIGGSSGQAAKPAKFFSAMKTEMEKYQGWPYVWGGKNPTTGFDCSGLTSYLYAKVAGINIVSYTVTQYEQSEAVSVKDAQAGDLIFFRGTYGDPSFISHVGIYINETTMYDSNSSGIGYHNWTDSYWSKHSPEIRRVKQ